MSSFLIVICVNDECSALKAVDNLVPNASKHWAIPDSLPATAEPTVLLLKNFDGLDELAKKIPTEAVALFLFDSQVDDEPNAGGEALAKLLISPESVGTQIFWAAILSGAPPEGIQTAFDGNFLPAQSDRAKDPRFLGISKWDGLVINDLSSQISEALKGGADMSQFCPKLRTGVIDPLGEMRHWLLNTLLPIEADAATLGRTAELFGSIESDYWGTGGYLNAGSTEHRGRNLVSCLQDFTVRVKALLSNQSKRGIALIVDKLAQPKPDGVVATVEYLNGLSASMRSAAEAIGKDRKRERGEGSL